MRHPYVHFSRLKRRVSIERLLRATDLTSALHQRGRRLVGPCPVHRGDNPTAFVADLDKGVWHCFTRCGSGGDVVELARRLGDGTYRQAARLLAKLEPSESTSEPSSSTPARASLPSPASVRFRPFTRRLPLDPTATFLRNKGIRPTTAQLFEAGRFRGRGFCAGCVAVRLHDPQGRPLGYAARRLDPSQIRRYGKWKLPRGLPKRRLLFGYHRYANPSRLVVVECPWGVMRLAQVGVPAVALLGTTVSDSQRAMLSEAPVLVLLLDGDRAGRKATFRLQQQLFDVTDVRSVLLPDGLDPDDLADEQLLDYLRPC